MARYQGRSRRKPSGGLYKPFRKPRKYELGRDYIPTILSSAEIRRKLRVCGGNFKLLLLKAMYANVSDPKRGITKRVRILKVVDNPANKNYARRGIITKGAIIETELGLAQVTSRPGQDGIINAKLIQPKEEVSEYASS